MNIGLFYLQCLIVSWDVYVKRSRDVPVRTGRPWAWRRSSMKFCVMECPTKWRSGCTRRAEAPSEASPSGSCCAGSWCSPRATSTRKSSEWSPMCSLLVVNNYITAVIRWCILCVVVLAPKYSLIIAERKIPSYTLHFALVEITGSCNFSFVIKKIIGLNLWCLVAAIGPNDMVEQKYNELSVCHSNFPRLYSSYYNWIGTYNWPQEIYLWFNLLVIKFVYLVDVKNYLIQIATIYFSISTQKVNLNETLIIQ